MDEHLHKFLAAARQAIRVTGLEQKDVAIQLNVTPQHLNAVLNGRANLSRKLEESLCRMLNIPPVGWWMAATRENALSPPDSVPQSRSEVVREEPQYFPVPLRGGLRAYMAFQQDWLGCRTTNPRKLFLVRMEGDTMRPEIPDGALVLVDAGQCEPAHGRIFYVRLDGISCFRRLESGPGRGLTTHNGESMEILGRALWQCGDL